MLLYLHFEVSGEYAMIHYAVQAGVYTLKEGLLEILRSMRRAGKNNIKIIELLKLFYFSTRR